MAALGVIGRASRPTGTRGRRTVASRAGADASRGAQGQLVCGVVVSATPSSRFFLGRNRATGSLRYVGGGEQERTLRKVWKAFNVLSSLESGQDTLHSAPVRIYDRSGTWVATLHAGADLTEANLAHDIRVALRA